MIRFLLRRRFAPWAGILALSLGPLAGSPSPLAGSPSPLAGSPSPLAAASRPPFGFEVDLSLANTRLQPQSTTRARYRLAQTGAFGPYRQLVFALDASESMAGAPVVALRRSVQRMVADLDRLTDPPLEVGVVQFGRGAFVLCDPSKDRLRLAGCLAAITTTKGSDLGAGLAAATDLLDAAASEPSLGGSALILVADGSNAAGCEAFLAVARRARQQGALVGTVALGDAADGDCLVQAASEEAAVRAEHPAALEGALSSFPGFFVGPSVGPVMLTLALPSHLQYAPDSADLVPWLVTDRQITWVMDSVLSGGVDFGFGLTALGTGRGAPVMAAEVAMSGFGRRTITAVGPVVSVGAPPACACPPTGPVALAGGQRASLRYPLVVRGPSGCEAGGASEEAVWWEFEICGGSPTAATVALTAAAGSRMAVYQPGVTRVASCRSALASGPSDEPLVTVLKPGPFAVALFGAAALPDAELPELTLRLGCAASRPDEGPRQVDVWTQVYGAEVYGRLPYNEPVAGVLRDPDGRLKAQSEEVYLDADGEFRLTFTDDGLAQAPVPILPHDHVFITPSGGRTMEIVVPAVSASADVATDEVAGQAPPGSAIEVSALPSWATGGEPAVPITRALTADAGGRYRVAFAGHPDLVPGSAGEVRMRVADGLHFVWAWTAPRLSFRLDAEGLLELAGVGPYLRTIRAELLAADGRLVARGTGRVASPGSPADWRLGLVDVSGAAVDVLAGDRLVVRAGDDTITATVPSLAAEVDLATGRLEGKAPPSARVAVRGNGFSAATAADASGRLALDLTPWHRYRGLDHLAVDLWQGGHLFSAGRVPGLKLAMRSGCLAGRVAPRSVVLVTVADPGTVPPRVGRSEVNSAADGSFSLCPTEADARPGPGTTLTVAVGGAVVSSSLSMAVPAFDVAAAASAGHVTGQASAQGDLSLALIAPRGFDRQLMATRSLTLPQGGPFDVALGQAPYAAGTVLVAEHRLASGHALTVTTATPSVRAEHGGSALCGTGRPGDPVTATLEDQGRAVIARASGSVDEEGHFSLQMRRASLEPKAQLEGEALRLKIGAESFFVPLTSMRIDVDFVAGLMTGQLPPRTPYEVVLHPAGCLGRDRARGGVSADGGVRRSSVADVADADGRFGQRIKDPLAPGEALLVHVPLATGGLLYRRAIRPLVIAADGSAFITGLASPGEPLAARLEDAAGRVLAAGESPADAEGRYRLTLLRTDGRPYPAGSGFGWTLAVTAAGEAFLMPLEKFGATFSRDVGLVATAPPTRELRLRLTLRADRGARLDYGGRPLTSPLVIPLTTDDEGRAAFGAKDVPPRGGWTLADVTAADLALVTPRGDELRLSLPMQPAGGSPLFLPWVQGR